MAPTKVRRSMLDVGCWMLDVRLGGVQKPFPAQARQSRAWGQIPNTRLQKRPKHQTSMTPSRPSFWRLRPGVFPEFGAWCLELGVWSLVFGAWCLGLSEGLLNVQMRLRRAIVTLELANGDCGHPHPRRGRAVAAGDGAP